MLFKSKVILKFILIICLFTAYNILFFDLGCKYMESKEASLIGIVLVFFGLLGTIPLLIIVTYKILKTLLKNIL